MKETSGYDIDIDITSFPRMLGTKRGPCCST